MHVRQRGHSSTIDAETSRLLIDKIQCVMRQMRGTEIDEGMHRSSVTRYRMETETEMRARKKKSRRQASCLRALSCNARLAVSSKVVKEPSRCYA